MLCCVHDGGFENLCTFGVGLSVRVNCGAMEVGDILLASPLFSEKATVSFSIVLELPMFVLDVIAFILFLYMIFTSSLTLTKKKKIA